MDDKILKINGKLYDVGTKNEEFLQFAEKLKMEGLKEWYAPLEIQDTFLAGISPELIQNIMGNPEVMDDMTELAVRIMTECRHNIWFYLREILRIEISPAVHCAFVGLIMSLNPEKERGGGNG